MTIPYDPRLHALWPRPQTPSSERSSPRLSASSGEALPLAFLALSDSDADSDIDWSLSWAPRSSSPLVLALDPAGAQAEDYRLLPRGATRLLGGASPMHGADAAARLHSAASTPQPELPPFAPHAHTPTGSTAMRTQMPAHTSIAPVAAWRPNAETLQADEHAMDVDTAVAGNGGTVSNTPVQAANLHLPACDAEGSSRKRSRSAEPDVHSDAESTDSRHCAPEAKRPRR